MKTTRSKVVVFRVFSGSGSKTTYSKVTVVVGSAVLVLRFSGSGSKTTY